MMDIWYNKLQYIVYIMIHLSILPKDTEQCSRNLCFTWAVTTERLTLKCKANHLIHKVFIYDQLGQLQADCLPPFPQVNCVKFYTNGSITQHPQTNETIYIVKGKIDDSLNGNWTCRHGLTKDVARVEVTIFKIEVKGTHKFDTTTSECRGLKNASPGLDCMKETLVMSFISFFLMVMLTMIALAFCNCSFAFEDVLKVALSICTKEALQCWERKEVVYRMKTITFWFFTLVYFGVIVAVTMKSGKSCTYKYVFPVLGPVFGILSSCLCLGRKGEPVQRANTENWITESINLSQSSED